MDINNVCNNIKTSTNKKVIILCTLIHTKFFININIITDESTKTIFR